MDTIHSSKEEYLKVAEKYYYCRLVHSLRLVLVTRKWTPEEFLAHESAVSALEMRGYRDEDLKSEDLVERLLLLRKAMETKIHDVRRFGPYF